MRGGAGAGGQHDEHYMKYIFILWVLLAACTRPQPVLVAWEHELVKRLDVHDFSYHDNPEAYIKDYHAVRYADNQIFVTTLIDQHCGDSILIKLEVGHDTIYLKKDTYWMDERACPELHKISMVIDNPSGGEYVLVVER